MKAQILNRIKKLLHHLRGLLYAKNQDLLPITPKCGSYMHLFRNKITLLACADIAISRKVIILLQWVILRISKLFPFIQDFFSVIYYSLLNDIQQIFVND